MTFWIWRINTGTPSSVKITLRCIPILVPLGSSFNMCIACLVTQWCPTLWPMDGSPPDSSVHRALQAQIVQWIAIPFSRGSSQPRNRAQVSSIAGKFFTIWATREAKLQYIWFKKSFFISFSSSPDFLTLLLVFPEILSKTPDSSVSEFISGSSQTKETGLKCGSRKRVSK